MVYDFRSKQAEVHLTYRCDLACPACNRGCFYKKRYPPDMTIATFVRLIDDIVRLGFRRKLVILGGEPTLHPDFLVFLTIGQNRGFEQVVYSNGYSGNAKELLEYIKQSHLATVKWGTLKESGSDRDLGCQTVFCAARDLQGVARHDCDWRDNPSCGYSVDELGYTPCPPGGMISYWQCPHVRASKLSQLLDQSYIDAAFRELCSYCGAYLNRNDLVERRLTSKRYGTLMTESWLKIFNE